MNAPPHAMIFEQMHGMLNPLAVVVDVALALEHSKQLVDRHRLTEQEPSPVSLKLR